MFGQEQRPAFEQKRHRTGQLQRLYTVQSFRLGSEGPWKRSAEGTALRGVTPTAMQIGPILVVVLR